MRQHKQLLRRPEIRKGLTFASSAPRAGTTGVLSPPSKRDKTPLGGIRRIAVASVWWEVAR
jgi:hypothetical protein